MGTPTAPNKDFEDTIKEFVEAVKDKVDSELQSATNKIKESAKDKTGTEHEAHLGTTVKDFVDAAKDKLDIEIQKITKKIKDSI